MCWKATSAVQNPPMMYLAQKKADSTTSYGKTVVESGGKIKSYSMSRLGGPIMPCFAAECCRIWRGSQKIQRAPISSVVRLAPGADAEFIFSPYIAIQQNLSLYMPTGADIRLLLLAVL